MDYIIPIGDNVYFIGEQYSEQVVTTYNANTHTTSTTYHYLYMDVIIAKVNSSGEFEWIKNSPLRNALVLSYPHVFKQYIAVPTANAIYIINNENAKNMAIYKKPDYKPRDFKTMSGIHGSNFVCNTISLADGANTHSLIFNNKTYCFAPIQERNPQFMPPSDTEIYVKGDDNEIYVYTENKGKDKFVKLTLE
jgi:hypothetical protein